MNYEKFYNWGVAAKEWAQVAFWSSGTVMLLTASYRFLSA